MIRLCCFCYSVLQIVGKSLPFALLELLVKGGAYIVLMLLTGRHRYALITCEGYSKWSEIFVYCCVTCVKFIM